VADRAAAAANWQNLFGAEVAREADSAYLAAKRTIMAFGESEVELCQPDGAGRCADFLNSRGEGLMTGGLSTSDMAGLTAHLAGLGMEPVWDGEQFYLEAADHFGMPFVISPSLMRPRVGLVNFLYEITNTLTSDWRMAAAHFAGLFNLDARRFSAIGSERFGYKGTLTLFNPPERLDRIEISQVTNDSSAMGRWATKHGDSLYMCYCETHDLSAFVDSLDSARARWTPRGESQAEEQHGLWVHPSATNGLLLGVSRTTFAWNWSGRPEIIHPSAGIGKRGESSA
jgi:hypothetical protein